LCGKEVGSKKANLHHIDFKSDGGTDRVSNLALLHESCHKKLHKQNLGSKLKKCKRYSPATFMNIVKWKFAEDLDCEITYGSYTYTKRIELGLDKTHYNDAFVIAGGSDEVRSEPYYIKQKRKNNRCLQQNRSHSISIRRQRYSLRPQDLVKLAGRIYKVRSVSIGKYVRLFKGDSYFSNPLRRLDVWVYHVKTLVWLDGEK
jgi:HNH endonuclease